MKKILILTTLLLLAIAGWSQILTPAIRVTDLRTENKEEPVRISDVKIDVKVVGSLAITTVDMTFFNPNLRILEGELQFPLADGQSISRFALDINGKLREGVVVEKAKGQKTFESIIRRGVDPGLLEKTEGNNFRTRVYPLPAKGTRRVVIAYEQELVPDNGEYRFFLPVEYRNVLDNFNVNLTVYSNEQQPKIDQTPWGNFKFDKTGDAYIASHSAKKYPAKGQIVFSVPVKDETKMYVENGKISRQTVFYTQIFPDVKQKEKKLPSNIALFWDASSSMSRRISKSEFELLDKYFEKTKNLTVKLYTFNCKQSKPQTFHVQNGQWNDLRKTLENIPYDGATQLGALDLAIQADEILLFSDGLSNFGKTLPKTGNTPVTTVSSAMKADYSILKYLSSATGGAFINLMQMTTDEAMKQMTSESLRLIGIDYNKNEIEDLATSGSTINPQQGLSVAGRLTGKRTALTLKFGIGNKVSYTEKITVDASNAVDYGNMVERLWAAKRIEQLEQLYEQNKEKIGELGRTYNIVTRNTSLIVLEEIMDYIQYDIAPPEELKEEYDRLKEQNYRTKEKNEKERIDYALKLLDKRKKWWEKKYNTSSPPSVRRSTPVAQGDGTYTITGTVKGVGGEELIGVTIQIEDKPGRGTVTDVDGRYTIRADRDDKLSFNYIGFFRQTVEVSGDATIDIVLEEDTSILKEIVVTGVGAQRRESNVGSVTATEALAGNVQETVSQQDDASASEFWIRGISTFDSNSNVLVLIDGIESNINDIDPEDIELFSVLKDPSSTSLYGARAANGVVIITTKAASKRQVAKGDIWVKQWQSDAPYMKELRKVKNSELYAAYLKIKKDYTDIPYFYLDVATLFEERGMKEEAFIILSNLAEIKIEDYRLLRVLAHRLKQLEYTDDAIGIFCRVLELRPEEPQSYRDLGLAYAQNGDYPKAVDTLYEIIIQSWDNRFPEIEMFAIEEINNIVARANREKKKIDLSKIDERLIFNMPVDIRIVLNWDTDNSDMDLWVTDPYGEKCFYSHKLTKAGGMITNDFTQGYGPEAFLITNAAKGKYIIKADYFGTREQTLIGTTTIYLDIFMHYGTPEETKKTIMLRLNQKKEVVDIGEIKF